MSNKPFNHVDERTPLVNGGAGPSGSDHNLAQQNGSHPAYAFFLDSNHTPGLNHDRFAVRSIVYSWHITKVTILSSTVFASSLLRPSADSAH